MSKLIKKTAQNLSCAKNRLIEAAEALERAQQRLAALGDLVDLDTEKDSPAPTERPGGTFWVETCSDCGGETYKFYDGDDSLNGQEGCQVTVARNVKRRNGWVPDTVTSSVNQVKELTSDPRSSMKSFGLRLVDDSELHEVPEHIMDRLEVVEATIYRAITSPDPREMLDELAGLIGLAWDAANKRVVEKKRR